MGSPKLGDMIALTDDKINECVTRTSPGVYVLDSTTTSPFKYEYVGRSDSSLNSRLHSWVGTGYRYFKAAYSTSPKDAFESECHLYHDFNPPDNSVHPARPKGSNWVCPRCTVFD